MRVTVVGAGMSGVACAAALGVADADVRLLEREPRPGGRMGGAQIDGRTVDLGAAYLTASDPEFQSIVDDWCRRGLARPWTTAFRVSGPAGLTDGESGPVRYAAPFGLASLVDDLARDLPLTPHREVRDLAEFESDADTVVLAMPDPQAAEVGGGPAAEVTWQPALAVVLRYPARDWPADLHGCFVNDDAVLTFLADDGDRRGDGAPVLVAHTTPDFTNRRPDDVDAVVATVRRVLGLTADPVAVTTHWWAMARPSGIREATFALSGGIGRCGDTWGDTPRVQTAWLSGRSLARAILGG